MKFSLDGSRTDLDQALISLMLESAEKYGIFLKAAEDIDPTHIEEMFELAMDVIGDNKRLEMRHLPSQKKLMIIKQLLVYHKFI
jgi:hypothetical protein